MAGANAANKYKWHVHNLYVRFTYDFHLLERMLTNLMQKSLPEVILLEVNRQLGRFRFVRMTILSFVGKVTVLNLN